MSDEETEVKSFADTIKVSKSSAIKIDVTNEVNDGRISVVSADVADTNELKKLFREDIVSNMKRFREAKEEEEMMKVLIARFENAKKGIVVLDPKDPVDKKIKNSTADTLNRDLMSWERKRKAAKKAADEARNDLAREEKRFKSGSKVVDLPFKEGERWYMYMTKPPMYIQTESYMPQKECRATLYREIAYKLTRKMDSFDLENMLDLYDRYKEALPDSDRAAKQYFERRLHDIEKVKSQDNFTVGKARQMFARMLSEWDMNKMGTLLDLEGTSHVNKAHANSVIDKKMQNIWRQEQTDAAKKFKHPGLWTKQQFQDTFAKATDDKYRIKFAKTPGANGNNNGNNRFGNKRPRNGNKNGNGNNQNRGNGGNNNQQNNHNKKNGNQANNNRYGKKNKNANGNGNGGNANNQQSNGKRLYNFYRFTVASESVIVEPWEAPNIKKEKEKRDALKTKKSEPIFIDDKVNSFHYKRPNLAQNMPPAVEEHLQTTIRTHKAEL